MNNKFQKTCLSVFELSHAQGHFYSDSGMTELNPAYPPTFIWGYNYILTLQELYISLKINIALVKGYRAGNKLLGVRPSTRRSINEHKLASTRSLNTALRTHNFIKYTCYSYY